MPKNSVCLDTTSLNSLSQGSCQEPLLTWHLWHLEECTECCERLEQLIPTDNHRFQTHTTLTLGSFQSTTDLENQPWAGLENSLQDFVPPVAMPKLNPSESQDEIGRLGEFRILRPIGAGHSAIVFEAEDIWLQRRVAIKILRRDMTNIRNARQLFLAEAQAVASIADKNVVPILNIGQQNDEFYLVMPLLEGESLKTALETRSFSTAEALKIIREIASGLTAAHKIGLIHCDIKPNNVWLMKQANGSEIAVLLDFGLSALNTLKIVAGTPGFMAPEQISGGNLDTKTDLFGLGCLLMEILRPANLKLNKLSEPDPAAELEFKSLLKPVQPLLQKLLNPDPALRPADTTTIIDLIRRLEKPRKPWLIPTLVGISALVLLAIGLTFRNPVQPDKLTLTVELPNSIPNVPQNELFRTTTSNSTTSIGKSTLFAFDPNGQRLIWADPEGGLFLKNTQQANSIPTRWQSSIKPALLSLNPTCRYLAIASNKGEFEVWDLSPTLASPKLIHTNNLKMAKLNDITWSDEPEPRLAFAHNASKEIANPFLLDVINPFLTENDKQYQLRNTLPYETIKMFWRPKSDEIICNVSNGGFLGWSLSIQNYTIAFRMHNLPELWLGSDREGDRIVSTAIDGFFLEFDGKPQAIDPNPSVALGWGLKKRSYLNTSIRGLAMISHNTAAILVDKSTGSSPSFIVINLDAPNNRMFVQDRTSYKSITKLRAMTNRPGSPEIACISEDGTVNIFNLTDLVKEMSLLEVQK